MHARRPDHASHALDTDTIAAVATPAGRGGIGVVRVSGPRARHVLKAVANIGRPRVRVAQLTTFRDATGQAIDTGLALYFAAPRSFTGEDVVELQGHGGPIVMDLLLSAVLACGVRQARPGEFTERAYLNDKLDLAQAEAVADLIDSASVTAARNAVRSLQGEFSVRVQALARGMLQLRVYIEAAIDFPDEDVDFLADGHVHERAQALADDLASTLDQARQGVLLAEGLGLALAGRPNAGKSSLLNRLAGYDRAIVTDIAGTTRDTLHEHISVDGLPLRLIDTAGLHVTDDVVEREGIRRAQDAIAGADRVLLVTDSAAVSDWQALIAEQHLPQERLTIVHNKIDLSGDPPGVAFQDGFSVVRLSALTGAGIDALIAHLKQLAGLSGEEGVFSARRRHVVALEHAQAALKQGLTSLETLGTGELLAEDLKLCHDHLGSITGRVTADALLGEIFSTFCIGK